MYPVVGRLVYSVAQSLRGEPVLEALEELKKSQWYSREKLFDTQWDRLKQLLTYAYYNVPFYKERFDKTGIHPNDIRTRDDYTKIPYLTKEDICGQNNKLVSQDKIKYAVARTSGSTGTPLSVNVSNSSWGYHHANIFRALEWYGIRYADKQARVSGLSTVFKKRVVSQAKDLLFNRVRLGAHDLNREACLDFYRKMTRFRPKYLYGYPTSLYEVALFCEQENIDAKALNLAAAVCHGEELESYQRDKLQQVFGCAVVDGYGAAEVGIIAYQCPDGNMHIPIESIMVESVDLEESGDTGLGEIVVTDLHNYSMPIIRYRIGDTGFLRSDTCSCKRGLPLLGNLKGKLRQTITTPDGKKVHTVVFNDIFKDLLSCGIAIKQWQVVQTSEKDFKVNLVTVNNNTDVELGLLKQKMLKCFGDQVKFSYQFVERIEKHPSGKFRAFISC